MPRVSRGLTLVAIASLALLSCKKNNTYAGGCLKGGDACVPESPCQNLTLACPGGDASLEVKVIGAADAVPGGWKRMGTVGDIMLRSGKATAVISALGHQYHLEPGGGALIDLTPAGQNDDGLNAVYQVAGVLPSDAFHFTSMQLIDERPNRVGVAFRGALDGRPNVRVATLYEMRPCDPGVRVRSEVVNESPDPQTFMNGDAIFWGNNVAPSPFTPPRGFRYPPFSLTGLDAILDDAPYAVSTLHSPSPDGSAKPSYYAVACNEPAIQGVHNTTIGVVSAPRSLVQPRDYSVFERFWGVAPGSDVAAGADQALAMRKAMFNEDYVTITGQVTLVGGLGLGSDREASILIEEGTAATPDEQRKQWTQAVPDASGYFSARVPKGKTYVVEVHSFGRKEIERDLGAVDGDKNSGTYALPSTARLNVRVLNGLSMLPLNAEVWLVPADATVESNVVGSFHGVWWSCAPYMGAPSEESPNCNRFLTKREGPVSVELKPGRYHAYAYHGPFWTLDGMELDLAAGTPLDLDFRVHPLIGLQPAGTLGADMHIHGAASHDSNMPDEDRVRSFSASDLDVAIATDHDFTHDYSDMVQQLGMQDEISTVVGFEVTPWIPYLTLPFYAYPLDVGHFNFWPLKYDPKLPRNGAPDDEYMEPGQIYDQAEDRALFTSAEHVVQINHPFSSAEFGRDLGFARAIFMDITKDLPANDDGTGNGVFVRAKGRHRNSDQDAEEVINGSKADTLLPYRALWFYLLNEGLLRAGTANSDSHFLADATVGIPRTLVYTSTTKGPDFRIEEFDKALKEGRAFGTNGPMIEASIDSGGTRHDYSLAPFTPAADATLQIRVRAAPWIPVDEIRIVVNGQVVKTIPSSDIAHPADPFGTSGVDRYSGAVALSELLTGVTGDAWIVVEAGQKLMLAADLGGGLKNAKDGFPDTTDNNGDGVVDARDVPAGKQVGPLLNPPMPPDTDPAYPFYRVTEGGFTYAFTNPFVLDRNANGKFDPPGVTGGR